MTNKINLWAIVALITPSALLYSQFLGNPLVFDDLPFFYGNNFGEAYSKYSDQVFSFDLRWLPYASFIWTRDLIGEQIIWLHLGNLILHLFTVITLFLFLRRLFELVIPFEVNNKNLPLYWLAFFAALIFSLHPVSVYAVAYLSQRSMLMATLFTLLSWSFFLEGVVRQKHLWLLASVVSYFLAVLSKEHAIMAPAVAFVLLVLISPAPRQQVKLIWPTFVLYGLIGIFVIIQIRLKHQIGQIYEPFGPDFILRLGPDFDPRFIYPLSIITQSALFFKYLWVWIVPSPRLMSVDICQNFTVHLWSWPELAGLIGFIIYPFVASRLLLQKGINGLLGFALLCPWLLFATEISTVRIQEAFVLYRSYIWMAGFFASFPFLCQKLSAKQSIFTLLFVALLMMVLALFRLQTFSHPLLLWDDAVRIVDDKWSCPVIGRILNNRGREYLSLKHYPEAIDDFTIAIKATEAGYKLSGNDPFDLDKNKTSSIPPLRLCINYHNRGLAYLKSKQYQHALYDFNRAIDLIPEGRGDTYIGKAEALECLNDNKAALEIYEFVCSQGNNNACNGQKRLEAKMKLLKLR